MMRSSIIRLVVFLKSGIRRIQSSIHRNKKTIFKYLGKIVIFFVKTIIEMILQDWF
jgi:hypothetical protein